MGMGVKVNKGKRGCNHYLFLTLQLLSTVGREMCEKGEGNRNRRNRTTHLLVISWLLVPFQALEINGGFRWQRLITRHYQETVRSVHNSIVLLSPFLTALFPTYRSTSLS